MKAVFSVSGDGDFPQPSYEITICFNGAPGIVILEVTQITADPTPVSNPVGEKRCTIMRSALQASHARAIASALLSASTEAKR